MSFRPHPRSAAVPQVTRAPVAHSEHIRGRLIRYSLAMGIRFACLLMLFIVPGWWKIVPIVGAIVLPWCAVVIANTSRSADSPPFEGHSPQTPQVSAHSAGPQSEHKPVLEDRGRDGGEA